MFEPAVDLLAALFVFIFGLPIVLASCRLAEIKLSRGIAIYVWHSAFAIVYVSFILTNGGDALEYFLNSKLGSLQFGTGTAAVVLITAIPASWLGLSFTATSLIFQIFGAVGLVMLDGAIKSTAANKVKFARTLAGFLVFLPSASFWTSGLGKDSLAFAGICLVLWGSQKIKPRIVAILFGIALVFIVRPHIAASLMVCLAGAVFFSGSGNLPAKALVSMAALSSLYFVIPIVIDRLNLAEAKTLADLGDAVSARQGLNMDGGSSVDIAQMNWGMKLFTYMFRPLFIDSPNALGLAASVENAFLLIFCIWTIAFGRFRQHFRFGNNTAFLIAFVLLTWVILAGTTANLGIALRQKWMILPAMFLLIVGWQRNVLQRPARRPPPVSGSLRSALP